MIMGTGGKSTYRASGMWFINKKGERKDQAYTFKNKHGEDTPKGMARILKERGLKVPKRAKCPSPQKCPERAHGSKKRFCCQMQALNHQPDFMGQGTMVEEAIKDEPGFQVIYYPKFHPELNFIEMYWGRAKQETRAKCKFSEKGFEATVTSALDSVSMDTIRAFAGRAFRYMKKYREGLSTLDAGLRMKQYTSHRR
ncbi:MAG: hypothetical protein J3Q66DRAFT_419998, partial [Benniella sp.]